MSLKRSIAVCVLVALARPILGDSVQHCALFRFKDGATPAEVREVFAGIEQLPSKIRGITGLQSFQSGPDNLDRGFNKGFNAGYFLTFINSRARDDYLIHPAHKEFGKSLGPSLDEVLVLDFAVAPSDRSLLVVVGLEPYAVYQRNEKGVADLKFHGISRGDGPIEARLRAGRRTVARPDWKAVGK